MRDTTKILLADDHAILRNGLRTLLQNHSEFEVVGEACSGRQAIEMVKQLSPNVIVMDVCMPDLNGIDAARQALAVNPDVKVIALSARSDDHIVLAMARAGAAGYVAKASAFDHLIDAIQAAINNKPYFDRTFSADVAQNCQSSEDRSAFGVLTGRERQVLQLMAEGKATKEVAAHLDLSVKTIETHRRNLMEKLGIDNVAELTKYAIREGLTSAW